MTRKELIAEILTEVRQYDESNLVDYRSLNRWIKNEIKRFGVNVMTLTESFIPVENGKATLPEAFYQLKKAMQCKAQSYYVDEGCRQGILESNTWRVRTEKLVEWDNMSNQSDFKCVEEKVVFGNCHGIVRYTPPVMVKLKNGKRNISCAGDCANLGIQSSPYEISVSKDTIYTNFNEGTLYLEYYAIPTDEEGDLIISDNRNVQEYLIAYCVKKIIQQIWTNDDDTNLANKMSFYIGEESRLFPLAMTSVKMEALASSDWDTKLKQKNARDTNRYERMFPQLNQNNRWRR